MKVMTPAFALEILRHVLHKIEKRNLWAESLSPTLFAKLLIHEIALS